MQNFATNPKTQNKALKKALQSPLIGKHGKRKSTLLKEEVYKEIQAKILEKADKLIEAQIKVALTGNKGKPDPRVIEMLLNRAFGRPNTEVGLSDSSRSMSEILDELEKDDDKVTFSWQE